MHKSLLLGIALHAAVPFANAAEPQGQASAPAPVMD